MNVLASISGEHMLEYPSPSLYTDTVRHGARRATQYDGDRYVAADSLPRALAPPSAPGLGVGQFNYDAVAEIERLTQEGLER